MIDGQLRVIIGSRDGSTDGGTNETLNIVTHDASPFQGCCNSSSSFAIHQYREMAIGYLPSIILMNAACLQGGDLWRASERKFLRTTDCDCGNQWWQIIGLPQEEETYGGAKVGYKTLNASALTLTRSGLYL